MLLSCQAAENQNSLPCPKRIQLLDSRSASFQDKDTLVHSLLTDTRRLALPEPPAEATLKPDLQVPAPLVFGVKPGFCLLWVSREGYRSSNRVTASSPTCHPCRAQVLVALHQGFQDRGHLQKRFSTAYSVLYIKTGPAQTP